jgi:hypothetical protein
MSSSKEMSMEALGQKQVGLYLVKEMESLASVSFENASAVDGVSFYAKPLQAGQDRTLMNIVTKVMKMNHHFMSCLHKSIQTTNKPSSNPADII